MQVFVATVCGVPPQGFSLQGNGIVKGLALFVAGDNKDAFFVIMPRDWRIRDGAFREGVRFVGKALGKVGVGVVGKVVGEVAKVATAGVGDLLRFVAEGSEAKEPVGGEQQSSAQESSTEESSQDESSGEDTGDEESSADESSCDNL